jgi:hypothetical protein
VPILPVNKFTALSAGADLWIMPDRQNSHWTQEIDWYLNHIIQNSEKHPSQKMSQNVRGLLFENQIVLNDITSPNSDVLIAAQHQLPTQWVIMKPWNGQLNKWLVQINEHWKSLKYPSLRLFLPTGISVSECSREWQKISEIQDFSVVLDKD